MHIAFTADTGQELTVTFDATLAESHEDSVIATERAVESGASIADHVRPEPARLHVEAFVSNTPVREPLNGDVDRFLGGASLSFQATTLEAKVFSPPFARVGPISLGGGVATIQAAASVLTASYGYDRVRAVYEALRALSKSGTVVRMITSLREYKNMVILNISVPRTAEDGSGVTISFDAKEIRVANTQTVDAPEPSESRGRSEVNRGRQETTEAETDNRSFAARGADLVAGWFR